MLEFLHRVIDVLEEFIGDPLLATKIEGNYDVVAQLLGEMCDAGSVCNTEPNSLRDDVDVSGFLGKLLGGVGLPGYAGYRPYTSEYASLCEFQIFASFIALWWLEATTKPESYIKWTCYSMAACKRSPHKQ